MQKTKQQKLFVALLLAALLVMSVAPAIFAQDATTTAEQAAMQSKVTGVSGMLPGGQFAKMWLGLTPSQPGATIVVTAEWDRANADDSGVGFFILDQTGLAAVQNGSGTVVLDNIAAGSQNFFLNGPDNKQGASIRATGTDYTIVMYNDSASDANFKLKVENGYLTDDSNQVTVDTTVGGTPVATEEATAAPTTAPAVVAAPVAETVATTTTTTAAAVPATVPATTAAATTTVPAGPVRATVMEGELPTQFDQHFLSLEPDVRDGTVTLSMTFDPQDSQEVARRLNFIVLDEQGFKSYLDGESAFSLAKAAGSRDVVGSASNERLATFEVTGFGPYTAIVYNNSNVPAMYKLAAKGGILSDDSGQTITAKNAGGTTPATAAGVTTTTTTTAGTTTAAPAAAAAGAAAESTGREGEPGGTYTVKSGDTLALIARDIYGDFRLYEQICAFNSIANCDTIEIGDVIKLPTNAQIQSGATAAPAAAPATAATPEATPTTAAVASTNVVTTTSATATTATTTTAPTTAVTGTTGTVTTTKPATTTTTTTTGTGASGAAGAAGSIVDVAENAGQFTILLDALAATGLDEALAGSGPFTVFAPTDAAFNALLTGNNLTEDDLLRARELADILKYHVLSGKVLSADVTNGLKATTLQGKQVTFEVKDGKLFVNGAEVVGSDIPAGNGVIHAISAVILPPQ